MHASLDKLVHHREKSKVEGIDLHAFIYFISISNLSDEALSYAEGNGFYQMTTVLKQSEGEKIVGESPIIPRVKPFLTVIM